jgi:transcriptional regulator
MLFIDYVYFNQMSSQSTIRCSKETQSRLKGHGKMGDSFEKVVNRLLDEAEKDEA